MHEYDSRVARLADYLHITEQDARRQWRSIADRHPRPDVAGWRQVDFLPAEALLCLAASLLVNHRRYGGATSHRAPAPVPELAALFRRTPASILAKMANLDGSRPNGARHEVEAAAALLSHVELLLANYRTILVGARSTGIGERELPDFLSGDRLDLDAGLIGQDELAAEDIRAAIDHRLLRLNGRMGGAANEVTEQLLMAAVRIGQHRFATDVLVNCGRRFVFCGLTPGAALEGKGLLVASHIKPWRVSSDRERLDPTNGIAACPSHDVAFDRGLLWVNGGLRIHAGTSLVEARSADTAMAASFGQPPIADALVLPSGALPPGPSYLQWHRLNVAAA